jgi:protein TonB
MLAYAASRPRIGARHSSPNAMLAVIAAHVGLLAAVMSAKMDLPQRILNRPIEVTLVPIPQPPPPNPQIEPQPQRYSSFTHPERQVPLSLTDPAVVDPTPTLPTYDQWPGASVDPPPRVDPQPAVRTGARLLTPPSELKPPYPRARLLAEQEATLKLRLTIDERGRVVAVDPIGRADPAFLDAARRHLLAHWRYKPASEDGRALVSTQVITLRFQLDD